MCSCFKYVQKHKRLLKKALDEMSAFLLHNTKDMSQFYKAEGQLQNYLQKKVKKMHSAGRNLSREAEALVKQLAISHKELSLRLNKLSQKFQRKKDLKDPEYRNFLKHQVAENALGTQKILRQIEASFARLVSVFVVFPKIIRNLKGLFEEKKEKAGYLNSKPRTSRKTSRFRFFNRGQQAPKNPFSYIQNVFLKFVGTFSKSLNAIYPFYLEEDGLAFEDSRNPDKRKNSFRKNR